MNEKINAEYLYQETDRAEQERADDAEHPKSSLVRFTSSLDVEVDNQDSSVPTTILTSQNKREYQEDRAGVHRIKTKCPTNVIEAEEILREVVKTLAQRTHEFIPGSTLVVSMSWLEDASAWLGDNKHVTHVLTANIGDSRAMLCRTQGIIRLSCEHSLDRPQELTRRNITLKEISETETHIYLNGEFVARQLTGSGGTHIYPFMDRHPGLAMLRSLGDARLHRCPIFSREPSMSLVSLNIQEEIYLMTISDGITGVMSDEDVAEILIHENEDQTYEVAVKAIAKVAHDRGASDNLSVVITGLHNLKLGEVSLQFVADGHGGSETSQYIADNIENVFRDVMAKKIVKQQAQARLNLSDAVAAEPSQKKSCQSTQSARPPCKN